jgi:copper transport protein
MINRLSTPVLAAFIVSILTATVLHVSVPQAEAHPVQLSSIPAPNEQLAEAPETVTIKLSEPVEPSVTTVQVWDTSPAELPIGEPQFPDPKTVVVTMPPEMESGIYTVVWRALSTVDGHTWSGSFPFTILGPNGEVPEGAVPASLLDIANPPSDTPSALESVARWIVILGTAVMLGGTAYVLFVAWPAAGTLGGGSRETLQGLSKTILLVTVTLSIFFVLMGSLIQVLLQASDLGGLDKVGDLLLDTRPGRYMVARQILLAIGLLGVLWASRAGKTSRAVVPFTLVLLASIGVMATQSLVSHSASAGGETWKVATDMMHLLAASLWIGGLIHIGLAMPRWLDDLRGVSRTLFAADSFRRFSVLAAFSVLVLIISGILSALAQFTSFSQMWETTYGWALTGKLLAMLPLLVAGALNAFLLQPRIMETSSAVAGAADDDGGTEIAPSTSRLQRLLANTTRIEAVLGIVVLVAVGVLIQLQPPRAEAEVDELAAQAAKAPAANTEGYYLEAAQSGGLVVSLKIDPGEVGENTFEVGLGSEFGAVGEVIDVTLDFQNEGAGVGPSELVLPLSGSAQFTADGSNLSLPGDWEVTATIRRRGEDEDVQAGFDVPVASVAGGGAESTSVWDWPYEGTNSAAAVATIAVGVVGLVAVAGWQYRNMRRPS